MGKKFVPKLFPCRKKQQSSGDDVAVDETINAPPMTAPVGSEEGNDQQQIKPHNQPLFSYRPQSMSSRTIKSDNTSNGDLHSAVPVDENTKIQKADNCSSNRSSFSSVSHNELSPVSLRTIQVHTSQPEDISHTSSLLELENADADKSYEAIPLLDIIELPRGGVCIETSAVGHVQFGIPPETIKDSMNLGLPNPPSVYIVPVDRFCRDMGPALGINLAEFEFPAYYNFFVKQKRCTLIVDSIDAEHNIRKVFNETLLGPAEFRNKHPIAYAEEDFAPDFPKEAIPDFYRELKHFRIMPNGNELVTETLLKFCHFETAPDISFKDNLGAPPKTKRGDENNEENIEEQTGGGEKREQDGHDNAEAAQKPQKPYTYSQIRWIGKFKHLS